MGAWELLGSVVVSSSFDTLDRLGTIFGHLLTCPPKSIAGGLYSVFSQRQSGHPRNLRGTLETRHIDSSSVQQPVRFHLWLEKFLCETRRYAGVRTPVHV